MLIAKAISLICTILLSMLAAAFIRLSWVRDALPYNESGRYYDERYSVVYHDSAVVFYGMIALLMTILAALSLWWTWRIWHKIRQ